MESAAAVALRSEININNNDLINIVHDTVVCEGMRDISTGAVEKLLWATLCWSQTKSQGQKVMDFDEFSSRKSHGFGYLVVVSLGS